jgi:farnesyl diphosphate synthase
LSSDSCQNPSQKEAQASSLQVEHEAESLSCTVLLQSFQTLFERTLKEALHPLQEKHQHSLPASEACLPPVFTRYHEGLRYALLSPGKRFRPFIAYSVAQALRANQENLQWALSFGVALESIHAFSLAHDDLPCMDNDELRRGLPTLHKQFSEWEALLIGDTLQTFALHHVLHDEKIPLGLRLWASQCLTQAILGPGLIEGQYADMWFSHHEREPLPKSLQSLAWIHRMKTGAMIEASVMLGVAAGLWPKDIETHPTAKLLHQWGRCIGLLFQLSDDILDATHDTHTLGKTAGKDASQHKWTYVTALGLHEARAQQTLLLEEAQACLYTLNHQHALDTLDTLHELTTFVAHRNQ